MKKKNKTIAKGKREILRGIEEGEIERVRIAEDTDQSFKEAIEKKLLEKGIPYEVKGSMKELQALLSIEVPCGAIGYYKQLSLSCDKGSFEK